MDLGGFVNGQEGGLAHFAKMDCRLAIAQHGSERRLVQIDQESTTEGPVVSVTTIWMRSTWTVDGLARFSYSVDDARFTEFGTACRLSWGAYRGDRIGLYTFTGSGEKGLVDFRNFSVPTSVTVWSNEQWQQDQAVGGTRHAVMYDAARSQICGALPIRLRKNLVCGYGWRGFNVNKASDL